MKVRELIEALSKLNPELDVIVSARTGGAADDITTDATIDRIHGPWINPDGSEVVAIHLPDGMFIDDTTYNGTPTACEPYPIVAQQHVVLVETNATNGGDPAKRAMHANGEEHAADLVLWLYHNGVSSKVVTGDRYNEKLRNYNDRVSAAS